MTKLDRLFKIQPTRVYSKDQIVLYQGAQTLDAYKIKSGFIAVTDASSEGDKKILMILGEGDIFPLTWAFNKETALKYFYETITPTELEVCEIKKLNQLSDHDHEITKELLKHFVHRSNSTLSRLELVEKSNAETKLGYVFKYLALTLGRNVASSTYKVNMPVTHQMLADLSGVTRETVSGNIKELETKKAVVLNKTNFIVHIDLLEKEILS